MSFCNYRYLQLKPPLYPDGYRAFSRLDTAIDPLFLEEGEVINVDVGVIKASPCPLEQHFENFTPHLSTDTNV